MAEWLSKLLVPVTVTVYVPALVPSGTVTFNVDVRDPPDATVSEVGLRVAPKLVGTDAATSETVLLNPLSDVTFIVELPEAPALIVRADGDAEIEKSGDVTPPAAYASVLPYPYAEFHPAGPKSTAFFCRMSLTSDGVCTAFARINATVQVTYGHAIDVPLIVA